MATLNEVLALMQGRLTTRGWDALFICDRLRINYLLEQQYVTRYEEFTFLPYLNGRTIINASESQSVEVKSIVLGAPKVSFESATLADSSATVTMNIVGGEIKRWQSRVGASDTLLSTGYITEQQGFTLTMKVNLFLVVAEVDRQGRITMDLKGASTFTCDLLGGEHAERLGVYFEEQFDKLSSDQTVFQLGRIGLKGYHGLAPRRFRLRTQAAPGAKVRGAANEGDGVVLALIELLAGSGPGQELGADFPYLMPDDTNPGGDRKYTALWVLSRDMLRYASNNNVELPEHLSFPGLNFYEEVSQHTPHDVVSFGRISPAQTSIRLEPAFPVIEAGGRQQFRLLDWEGRTLTAKTWKAVSLQSHSEDGHGTIDNGLYTAVSSQRIGYHSLRVLVTATYESNGKTYTASTLLRVDYSEVEIAPKLVTHLLKKEPAEVTLNATAMGQEARCSLLAPLQGSLTRVADTQWRFVANAEAELKSFSIQKVLCETLGADVKTTQSTLVLDNAQSFLSVEPAVVERLNATNTVQLNHDVSLMPQVPRRWRVVSGVGSVDEGLYTAPPQGVEQTSVVLCEVVRNGVVFFRGYSVIGEKQQDPDPTWEVPLALFTIKVVGGPELETQGNVLANGYQQLHVQVSTQTNGVWDPIQEELKYYKLSLTELASMRLVYKRGEELPFIPVEDLGIDPGASQELQVHKILSPYFDLAIPSNPGQVPNAEALRANDSLVEQDFYLHSVAPVNSTAVLHARFQKDNADGGGDWINTAEEGEEGIGKRITVRSVKPATFVYDLTRVRIAGGSGGEPGNDNADFDLILKSQDWWTFKCRGQEFIMLEWLLPDQLDPGVPEFINVSSIRWESEKLEETMFSWLGYYFEDVTGNNDLENKVAFDDFMPDVVKDPRLLDVAKSTRYEPFTFAVLLCRNDNITFIRPRVHPRPQLDQDLKVALRDKNGNLHKQRISFKPKGTYYHRNYLDNTAL